MVRNRRSVTLVELVLVMLLLAVLGAVVVTLYPDLRDQAALSAAIATLNNLNTAFSLQQIMDGVPKNLDLLHDGTPTPVSIFTFPTSPSVLAPAGSLVAVTTIATIETTLGVSTGDVLSAFTAAGSPGFTSNGGTEPTLNVTFLTTPGVPPSDLMTITILGESYFGVPPPGLNSVYVVFGLGASTDFIGSTPGVAGAPLFTPLENDYDDPRTYYSRYLVVYKLSATGDPGNPVRIDFVVTAAPAPVGNGSLDGLSQALASLQS
jgi:type II secretory pathway pseudopilin PulG